MPIVHICLIVWLWLPSVQAVAEPVELVFYSTDSPPIWSANVAQKSLGAEILEEVAREADLIIKINYLPLKRYEQLSAGHRLGNPYYFIGQELAAVIPLLTTQAGFCYYRPRHPQGHRFHNLWDLNGMTLGVIRGTVAGKDEFLSYGVKIEENTSLEALFNKLKYGRIDAALVIDITAYYYINQLFPDEIDNFQFNTLVSGETPITLILDKNTGNADKLIAKIHRALQKIIANGRYYQILSRYQYGKAAVYADWHQRLVRAIDQYRASPIVIHE